MRPRPGAVISPALSHRGTACRVSFALSATLKGGMGEPIQTDRNLRKPEIARVDDAPRKLTNVDFLRRGRASENLNFRQPPHVRKS